MGAECGKGGYANFAPRHPGLGGRKRDLLLAVARGIRMCRLRAVRSAHKACVGGGEGRGNTRKGPVPALVGDRARHCSGRTCGVQPGEVAPRVVAGHWSPRRRGVGDERGREVGEEGQEVEAGHRPAVVAKVQLIARHCVKGLRPEAARAGAAGASAWAPLSPSSTLASSDHGSTHRVASQHRRVLAWLRRAPRRRGWGVRFVVLRREFPVPVHSAALDSRARGVWRRRGVDPVHEAAAAATGARTRRQRLGSRRAHGRAGRWAHLCLSAAGRTPQMHTFPPASQERSSG